MREAALSLHGLHWRDREWLLRRLLPGARTAIRMLLKELRTLGIAPGLGTDDDLPAADDNPALNAEDVAAIDAAAPAAIFGLFASEPEYLPPLLMRLRPWRWREAVWQLATPLQRSRIVDASAVDAHALPAAWRDALLHAIAQALREGAEMERPA
jgi:hypothetical protein